MTTEVVIAQEESDFDFQLEKPGKKYTEEEEDKGSCVMAMMTG